MQFAMQASVQAMRVLPTSVCNLRHQQVGSRRTVCVKRIPTLASQFLAPGLETLQLTTLRHGRKLRMESGVRAEGAQVGGGANGKDALVDKNKADKSSQVAERLERTASYFKRLGNLGFWGQLVCAVVAAGILAFSVVITGQTTSAVPVYLTAGGIAAAFLSVFWSFGYIRFAQKLRETVGNPSKAPPRSQVAKNLRNGIIINLLGMGATLLGLQSTVGGLVAKALTSSGSPYLQGRPISNSPVLALDVFLVQASGNAILAHFLGLLFSLELLRSVTQSPAEQQLKSV